jgi:hypothetical protein
MSHSTQGRFWGQVNWLRHSFLRHEGLPFSQVLSVESVQLTMKELGLSLVEPIYNALVTTWVFLSQVLNHDQSCRAAVARLLVHRLTNGQSPCSTKTGAYCIARGRLPEEFLARLTRQAGRALHEHADHAWRWKDRLVALFDGSTVSMPDTPENQAEYPQPRSQQPGIGFPLARIGVLFSWATGTVLDMAICPFSGKGHSELALLRRVWHSLAAGTVLVTDRYLCSYCEIARLRQKGIDAVSRLHQQRQVAWRKGSDQREVWHKPRRPEWMDQQTYDALPDEMSIRVVRFTVRPRGFRTRRIELATTLLDADQISKDDLAELYRGRWQAELNLRSLKCVMQMDLLRGRTPDIVRKEIWAHLLAYNLIRSLMAGAAASGNVSPQTLSFQGTLQILIAFQPHCSTAGDATLAGWIDHLLTAILQQQLPHRPGRYEPRARKRRPKPYPLLQITRSEARRKKLYASK